MSKNPKRGEFWYLDLNPVVGHEQGERRPCLVVSANGFNESPYGLIIIVPVTTTDRGFPSHIKIAANQSGLNYDSYAVCEHIRSVSIDRFENKTGGRAPGPAMMAIENALKILLSLR